MAEAANPQSETVSIDQITSIYKARPGFRVVPLEITDELTIRYSPEEAIGTAWYWIDGTKKRCLLVEVYPNREKFKECNLPKNQLFERGQLFFGFRFFLLPTGCF